MAVLDGSNIVGDGEHIVMAVDVKQYYDLLTGAMKDQPVLLSNRLSLTRDVAANPTSLPYFVVTAVADTLVANEANDLLFSLNRTLQFNVSSVPATQRAARVRAPTYAASGAAVITDAATFSIEGPPIAGTNMTLTAALALLIESGAIGFGTGGAGPQIRGGTGSPEAVVTAPPGSFYLSTNGNTYRKASGTGNTGWSVTGGMQINSIQRGTIAMATGDLTKTATVTAVDTTKAILAHMGQSSAADPGGGAGSFVGAVQTRITLTNSTTITATRGVTDSEAVTVGYGLTEWI